MFPSFAAKSPSIKLANNACNKLWIAKIMFDLKLHYLKNIAAPLAEIRYGFYNTSSGCYYGLLYDRMYGLYWKLFLLELFGQWKQIYITSSIRLCALRSTILQIWNDWRTSHIYLLRFVKNSPCSFGNGVKIYENMMDFLN